jgi:6-phosphogluconolactonase
MLVVIMGVSGSGKTTIGTMLAEELHCPFLDADVLHPEANVDAMKEGRALTDADRAPWLNAVHARMRDAWSRGEPLVVACSALKDSHRRALSRGVFVTWVYLKGDSGLIRRRIDRRTGHFMNAGLLDSQFLALEEPSDAIVADIAEPPRAIVQHLLATLRDRPDIRILADLSEVSFRAAETAVGIINETVSRSGRCSLVLSGGSTPRTFHQLLATTFRDRIPWPEVHVFWGDERYVPHDDDSSNYRMARETLLDRVPCPPENVHPMPTHFPDPDAAARDYQTTLERYWQNAGPQFDLALLGVGPDGHTASLFPGDAALRERVRLVVGVSVNAEPPRRLTLTFPALTRSAHVHFLVSGREKASAVSHVLSGANQTLYPAAGVRPSNGWVVWWLDRDAASALTPGRPLADPQEE